MTKPWTKQWEFDFTEEALAEELKHAENAALAAAEKGPCAEKVSYNVEEHLITIHLTNGATFSFPPDLAQGLRGANPEQLRDVWLDADGLSVHWESLDADFSVLGLLHGIFGTRKWMSELGRQGGKISTEAKREAARKNGKKGGRPKGSKSSASPSS
ncbi:DUF2442 domain-containing protein [Laspinema olomoucense]|uniref:DUF2442 domain-containing protein n=1 Tax=Laspinema olomoucense D3b TaxID=2953688 RepID=A0ABT2N7G4_9CYAN|nr:DUF2442 domain-containing protein [Laspinema sp. D3b]MCT7978625.1 DUF2442 domain-containing protein [Laspinema sp. D3b]